jgi:Protein of unknown function (DUF4435)
MPSSLKDRIHSDRMKAMARLASKKTPETVWVYVEDNDDIPFWRVVLDTYESEQITFKVRNPSNATDGKGKKAVLSLVKNTGSHLLLCVDSDYDYLLGSVTQQSKVVNENEFIFHTYAYSIENFRCFADTLHRSCVRATNNDNIETNLLIHLITDYSIVIYELFLWSIYFNLIEDTHTFTINNFCKIIKIEETVKNGEYNALLSNLTERVNKKVKELEEKFPHVIQEIVALSEKLKTFGVETTNTYLFVQGHTIQNNVVLMFLNPLCDKLRSESEAEIKKQAKTQQQKEELLQQLKNNRLNIKDVLRMNTDYKTCFLFKKIEKDFDAYTRKYFAVNMS